MPAYTLGELMSQATLRTGRHELSASQVSFLVNESAQEVASICPRSLSEKSSYITFDIGETFKELPADFGGIVVFSWLSGGSATTLTESAIDGIDSMGTARGLPTHFAYWRNGVEVRPVPSSFVTCLLRYRERFEDMVDPSDVPESIDTVWRTAILYKTEEKILHTIGDIEGEARARERYLSFVNSTPTDAQRRQEGQHPMGVHVRY